MSGVGSIRIDNNVRREDIAQVYRLTDKESDSDLAELAINTGAYTYLTYKERLEVCQRVLYKQSIGLTLDLDATQVYYYLKDGLDFNDFLDDPQHDEAFNEVFGETSNQYGHLYKQYKVVKIMGVFREYIGEELAILLALKVSRDMTARRYLDQPVSIQRLYCGSYYSVIEQPNFKKLAKMPHLNLDKLRKRNLFLEFEDGLIPNSKQVSLPEKTNKVRKTLRQAVYKIQAFIGIR